MTHVSFANSSGGFIVTGKQAEVSYVMRVDGACVAAQGSASSYEEVFRLVDAAIKAGTIRPAFEPVNPADSVVYHVTLTRYKPFMPEAMSGDWCNEKWVVVSNGSVFRAGMSWLAEPSVPCVDCAALVA